MNLIHRSLRRGFAAAKQDRIDEWASIRTKGFWKWFIKGDLIGVSVVVFIQGISQSSLSKPIASQIAASLGVALIISALLAVSAKFHWNRREKEWRLHQEAERVGEGNSSARHDAS